MSAEREKELLSKLLSNTVPAGRRHAYGGHPDQHVEVFGDPASCRAVVVYIHGGYFRQRADLTHARPLAEALAGKGALVVLPEYRRTGGDGGHPRTLEDITAALGFVRSSLGEWGVPAEAAARVVITGHSAGGCLAMSWASHRTAPEVWGRVVALSPITDLVREMEMGLAEGAVLDYMGVDFRKDPAPYLFEDPRSRVALIPEGFDLLLVHGTEDHTVDIGFARQFPAPLLEIAEANHFEVIDPAHPAFRRVAATLLPG